MIINNATLYFIIKSLFPLKGLGRNNKKNNYQVNLKAKM